MLNLKDGTVLRRVRIDDVDDAEHALVQGLVLRVRPPLEAVIHESEPEGDCTLVADQLLQLKIGPAQTLSFVAKPFGKANHAELGEDDEGRSRR